jgi:hypothetical protein
MDASQASLGWTKRYLPEVDVPRSYRATRLRNTSQPLEFERHSRTLAQSGVPSLDLRSHNPEVAGSNPAPATGKAPETGFLFATAAAIGGATFAQLLPWADALLVHVRGDWAFHAGARSHTEAISGRVHVSSSRSVGRTMHGELVLCNRDCRVLREFTASGKRLGELPRSEDRPSRFELAVQLLLLGDGARARMPLA